MKQQLKSKQAERSSPSLGRQIRDTGVGLFLVAGAGFLRWQEVLSEPAMIFFGALGVWFISKSLVVDFFKALPDWLGGLFRR